MPLLVHSNDTATSECGHIPFSKEVRIHSCDPSNCWKFNADHEYHNEKCARLHLKFGTFFTFPPMFGQTDVGGDHFDRGGAAPPPNVRTDEDVGGDNNWYESYHRSTAIMYFPTLRMSTLQKITMSLNPPRWYRKPFWLMDYIILIYIHTVSSTIWMYGWWIAILVSSYVMIIDKHFDTFFREGVKIFLSHSKSFVDISFDTFMPIPLLIGTNKQTDKKSSSFNI